MLPKKNRIPRKLYPNILESKRIFHSPNFILRAAPSNEVRISVSVSKKVSKKAVIRNRIRRRAYSALRDLVPKHSTKGLFLIIAKPGAENIKGEALIGELAELLKRG